MQQREKYEREVKTNIVILVQSDVKKERRETARGSLWIKRNDNYRRNRISIFKIFPERKQAQTISRVKNIQKANNPNHTYKLFQSI